MVREDRGVLRSDSLDITRDFGNPEQGRNGKRVDDP